MSNPVLIGTGILTWDGAERRSQRYGCVHLSSQPYNPSKVPEPFTLDKGRTRPLEGRQVRLTCTVLTSRPSGHVGDLHLGIHPQPAAQGESLELGVGILRVGKADAWDATVTDSIGLEPKDGRECFWVDPRILYQLHDQTVNLYASLAEGTPCHPAPDVRPSGKGVKATGGGGYQVVNIAVGTLIHPKIENLDDGLLRVGKAYNPGENVTFSEEN